MKHLNIKGKAFLVICILMLIDVSAQDVLTKKQAIDMALDYNYGIKIAYNNLEQADNNKDVLNSGYLPVISGGAGSTFSIDNTEAEFSNGNITELTGAESSRYNASLSLNYTLFDGMGRLYNYKRLKTQYQLSELEVRRTIENTMLQLFTVYYEVARTSENVLSLEETLNISKDRLQRAEYQFEFGQDTKLGVLNAQVDINNDSINLINAKQGLVNTKRDLDFVLGSQLSRTFEVDTVVTFFMTLNKEELLDKMRTNNIDLLQIETNLEISDLTIKTNRAGYLPTLGLTGTYGWNKNNNNAAAFLSTSTNVGLSAGLNLNWNIFDGGQTITRIRNAKIDLENQKLLKDQTLLDIERNFFNAWDDYQNKVAIYSVQKDNIQTAKNNFDRTEEKFKIGQATSIEFRQAQVNLLTAEIRKNQAKYDAKLAELVLLQLSGELMNVDF
ncbi:MAG: TolC family protein [Flavobacteriaceae bacterium]|nr:TolC family protein [Bacteroidia bacterium]NNF75605.1 TolC family protein [Flavobacteriaceae bacterium]NNK74394.1 TolC family protein [Flavobacteriaceae bacterium]